MYRFELKVYDAPSRIVNGYYDCYVNEENNRKWLVSNRKTGKTYKVSFIDGVFTCSCPDFKFRNGDGTFCKHIYSVLLNASHEDSIAISMVLAYPWLNNFFNLIKKTNERNCHFTFFSCSEKTKAWEDGKKQGEQVKKELNEERYKKR